MKILAIETSCEHATAALLAGGETLERPLEGHANHSEYLLPMLVSLLAEAQFRLQDLDAIAFGAGPGAFTGLRLACSVAQGLAMGAELRVVPVCSLAALAVQAKAERVFVASDARMGEAYAAAYRFASPGVPIEVSAPVCVPPEALVLPDGQAWVAIGSALGHHDGRFPPALRAQASGWMPNSVARACDVARIAAQELAAGRSVAPECAAPIYVRDKVALTTEERRIRGGRA